MDLTIRWFIHHHKVLASILVIERHMVNTRVPSTKKAYLDA